jgi:hypothetical protein
MTWYGEGSKSYEQFNGANDEPLVLSTTSDHVALLRQLPVVYSDIHGGSQDDGRADNQLQS